MPTTNNAELRSGEENRAVLQDGACRGAVAVGMVVFSLHGVLGFPARISRSI
jgi:hypothetical protein